MKPKTKKIVGAAAIVAGVAALTAGAVYAKKAGLDKKAIAKFKEVQKKAKSEYLKLEKKLVKEYNDLLDQLPINKNKKVLKKVKK
ncbi:MAG TPA: hypothetical protein PL066_00100 [bacterium]|nr:hypothetical protein [bacterium]